LITVLALTSGLCRTSLDTVGVDIAGIVLDAQVNFDTGDTVTFIAFITDTLVHTRTSLVTLRILVAGGGIRQARVDFLTLDTITDVARFTCASVGAGTSLEADSVGITGGSQTVVDFRANLASASVAILTRACVTTGNRARSRAGGVG